MRTITSTGTASDLLLRGAIDALDSLHAAAACDLEDEVHADVHLDIEAVIGRRFMALLSDGMAQIGIADGTDRLPYLVAIAETIEYEILEAEMELDRAARALTGVERAANVGPRTRLEMLGAGLITAADLAQLAPASLAA